MIHQLDHQIMRQRKALSVRAQLEGNRSRLTNSFRNGRKDRRRLRKLPNDFRDRDRRAQAIAVRDVGRRTEFDFVRRTVAVQALCTDGFHRSLRFVHNGILEESG